jgi:AcrR family transcriptional regulator
MLYYYFGDKDGLFLAALEERYAHIRSAERALELEHLEPLEALKRRLLLPQQPLYAVADLRPRFDGSPCSRVARAA